MPGPTPTTLDEAMALHGALLGHELQELGINPATDERLQKTDSPIGPLYIPRHRKHVHSAERGHHLPGRSISAATDGAYLRLFIARTPGLWNVPDPHRLGIFTSDLSVMPTATLKGQRYVVGGKVLGGGITTVPLSRHLARHQTALRAAGQRLLVVVPSFERYQKMANRHVGVLDFTTYSVQDALADNLRTHPGGQA